MISSLTLTDTNSYTPEINNVLSSNIDLKVIGEWMSYTPSAQFGVFVGGQKLH